MKTTGIKVNGYRLAMIGLVLGLAMTMQAVDYKNQYKHSVISHQYSDNGIEAAATPSTGFRSTSVYSSQMAERGQSLLNDDGSVNHEAYMGGPRRIGETPTPGGGGQPGTPGDPNDENQQPLGDVLWPLMLMAMMYAAVRVFRRKPESR